MFQLGKKISHRFLVAIMLIAVIPIIIMSYQTYVLARRTLIKLAYSHVSATVENHANHLDLWLQERLDDVGVLSRLPAIREACLKYCEALESGASPEEKSGLLDDTLSIIEGRSPSYENIYILLPGGAVMAATHPDPEKGLNKRDLSLLEELKGSEKPVFGPPYEVEGGDWHVRLATTIKSHDGKALGYIMAVLDLSKTIDPIMTHRIGLKRRTGFLKALGSAGSWKGIRGPPFIPITWAMRCWDPLFGCLNTNGAFSRRLERTKSCSLSPASSWSGSEPPWS